MTFARVFGIVVVAGSHRWRETVTMEVATAYEAWCVAHDDEMVAYDLIIAAATKQHNEEKAKEKEKEKLEKTKEREKQIAGRLLQEG